MSDKTISLPGGGEVSYDAANPQVKAAADAGTYKITNAPIATIPPTPIPTTSLTAPQTPVAVPLPATSSTAPSLSGAAGAVNDATKAQADTQAKAAADTAAAKTAADSSKNALQAIYDKITGVQSSQAQMETDAGIDVKTKAVNDATTALEASQRAQQVELKALSEQPGLSQQAVASAAQEINRRYAFNQADLAIVQSAANRDLTTAQALVDHKIKLQLEPLQTQLDYTKTFYQDNKDELTKDEDKQFNLLVKTQQDALDTATANKKAIGDIQLEALKNGVTIPANVLGQMNNAKDALEATQILAKNGISLKARVAASAGDISMAEYKKAQQFVKDNPNASPIELEQGIRANTKGLSEADIASLTKGGTKLSRANVASLYGMTDDTNKSGFLGFGKTNSEKLDDIMAAIKKYQDVGYTDAEILKLVSRPK